MPVNYSLLEIGNIISDQKYTLTQKEIELYLKSVQDDSDRLFNDSGIELAPPMSIAALSLRGVVNDLQIPGGTLHVGQEMEFKKWDSINGIQEIVDGFIEMTNWKLH